jgi:hypothetical protein
MRCRNKLLGIIAIFILTSLTAAVPVDAAGLAFNWQPFIARNDLERDHLSGDILPKKAVVSREMLGQSNIEYLLRDDLEIKNNFPPGKTKKSALSKIRVTISSVNSFLIQDDETCCRGKDEKLSQIVKTLPSLLQNPSSGKALETLKLIEPQVNVGFEF